MDDSSEIQETLGRSYNVPDDIDEDDLMGGMFLLCVFQISTLCSSWNQQKLYIFLMGFVNSELDALEADMGNETEAMPSYLQPDKEPDLDDELNLPPAPTGNKVPPPGRPQVSFL